MSETKLRKTMIVIAENGKDNGKGFDVYLDGDKERIGKVKSDDLSPAEFYGLKLFQICASVLSDANAITGVVDDTHHNKKGMH